MKKILMAVVKGLSTILAIVFRLYRPFSGLINRLIYLSKAQSKVNFSIPVSTQFDGDLQIIGTGKVTWGEHCRFGKDVLFETQGDGVIELGNHVRINQGSLIVAHTQLVIGNDCLIGEYCSIRDANHNSKAGNLIRTQGHSSAAITIGSDCWIGRGAVVLKGVTLHGGCIVGANSVVTKDVSSGATAVGIPARELKSRV